MHSHAECGRATGKGARPDAGLRFLVLSEPGDGAVCRTAFEFQGNRTTDAGSINASHP